MEAWLYRKWNLRPGEFWLRENGSKRLASRHPETEEVRICISYDQEPDAEKITLFIASVNPLSGHCELKSLTDLNTLQPSDFELWE